MTPRQVADKYPAQWQIHGQVVCLPLYESFAIAAEPVVVTVFTRDGMRVELGYKGLRVGELTPATPDNLVTVIAEKIAYMIAFHPGAVDLYKIPDWAKESTNKALETHKQRIQDTQTHLERSKK